MVMKIAIVVPPWIQVPPSRYGGIESIVALLADGLVGRGCDVTLFTVKESGTSADCHHVFDCGQYDILSKSPSECLNTAVTHSLGAYIEIMRQGDFDIVHDNTWKEGLASAFFIDIPVVHTIHGPIDDTNRRFYSLFTGAKNIHFVTISKFQQKALPNLNYAGNVYNAIEVGKYPYSTEKEDYLLYVGRFNLEKAPHIACKVAEELEMRLILAGKASEPHEWKYFNRYIKPHLSDTIRYVGEVSDAHKKELFRDATAFIYPIQWDEPFGIVIIEAMACGTPVVTYRRGAAPELVRDGVNGYLADDFDHFLDCVGMVHKIKHSRCRKWVETHFSADAMITSYENIYKKILEE
ncbi:MAG: glycosyltransferase family 4 protein [Candidatus Methanogasteraceae archaeon]